MIPLLAVIHRHHHRQRYRPHHLMEQQQSRHPLLQIKQPDINITSVDKKVLSGHYANHSLYGMKKTTQI
jgi:hypothetical protein